MEKELPKGWVLSQLKDVGDVVTGNTPPKKDIEHFGGNIPWIKPGDLLDRKIVKFEETLTESGALIARLLPPNSVMVSCIGNLGKIGIIDRLATTNQQINSVVFNSSIVNPFFGFYYALTLKEWLYENSSATTVSIINKGRFEKAPIPLPPLPEQQRIVAKLDTMFGHLDALKIRLEHIPQLLKEFRQKVLTQAVTGKLTEEWREGRELEEWMELPLNEFSNSRLGKMLDKEKNQGIPTKYLRNINVRWFDFDLDDLFEIKISEEEMNKYIIQNGDILVCEGGEPGRAAIWRNGSTNIIFQKALHRVRLNNNVLPEFFLYNLKVDSVNNVLSSLFTGTTIKHLTGVAFSGYTINIPALVEQQEIVRRVESLFAKADQIEASYQKLKAKIEQLPQALLAKAFRGELVPQLPTDGDARDLLEQIKRAKAVKMKK